MSEENVEVVRGWLEDDAWAALDPEIEYDTTRLVPDGDVYHGHEGVARHWRRWFGTWKEFEVEGQEFIDADDQVVVVIQEHAQGKGSGVEVETRYGAVCTLRDGKIVRVRLYPDKAEALEAVRLRE